MGENDEERGGENEKERNSKPSKGQSPRGY